MEKSVLMITERLFSINEMFNLKAELVDFNRGLFNCQVLKNDGTVHIDFKKVPFAFRFISSPFYVSDDGNFMTLVSTTHGTIMIQLEEKRYSILKCYDFEGSFTVVKSFIKRVDKSILKKFIKKDFPEVYLEVNVQWNKIEDLK